MYFTRPTMRSYPCLPYKVKVFSQETASVLCFWGLTCTIWREIRRRSLGRQHATTRDNQEIVRGSRMGHPIRGVHAENIVCCSIPRPERSQTIKANTGQKYRTGYSGRYFAAKT